MSYTYLAADVLTGTLLAELPLAGVSYDLRVNDAAVFSGTLPLDQTPGAVDLTVAGRTAIYASRGDQLVFGGIIWGRQYDRAARTLKLDCEDYLSYLDHLAITNDLAYAQADQLSIARSLVDYGMNKGGSDLGLAYTGVNASGVKRDRTYLAADQAFVGPRLRELANVDNGFDFRFSTRWESGYIRRVLQFGYPTLGRTWPSSGVVFEADTDTVQLTWTEDAKSSASTIYGTGAVPAGQVAGTLPPTYTGDASTVRSGGFPRLEAVAGFTDITQLATLQAHVIGQLDRAKLPPQTMTLTVSSSAAAPDLGSYLPGDQCLVRVGPGDPMWTYGAEIIAAIVTVAVTVDDEHNDAVTIGLAPISITEGAAH